MNKTKIIQSARAITVGLCFGAISLLTLTTGCAGDRYHESTGENIDDRGITSRVKSALGNDVEYKYSNVNVTTFKGTAQLSGFVDTSAQRSRAGKLAKNVDGVKEVENNITVKE